MPETWTTAQAAFIVEKPLDVLQKVLERGPVKPKRLHRAGRPHRSFEMRDLVFLSALDDLKRTLTASMQAELYAALKQSEPEGGCLKVEVGRLRYDFEPYHRLVETKIEAANKLLELIDQSGADPVISGTTIGAYRIAALCEGMSADEILQDYPSLDERKLLAAKVYAEIHPKAGRPYPKVTAKKALREASAQSADAFLPPRR